MKCRLQRVALGIGTLFVLFPAFLVVEHARGRWTLSRQLGTQRARGEVLSVAALEPRRPPAEQNSAIMLLAWSNRLDAVITDGVTQPHSLRFAAPGHAIVTAGLAQWSSDGKAIHTWKEVEADVERDLDLLSALRTAADRKKRSATCAHWSSSRSSRDPSLS